MKQQIDHAIFEKDQPRIVRITFGLQESGSRVEMQRGIG